MSRATGYRALVALAVAAPAIAHAQDVALAETLFRKGLELRHAGKTAEACPLLEQSAAIDPAGGTLFALADCLEAEGLTATAWARFGDALAVAKRRGNAQKEKETSLRIAKLEAQLARVSLDVAAPVDGLTVLRDGAPVPRAAWGIPVPTDPGAHVYEARAEHKKAWSARIDLAASATLTVHVPALETDAPPASSSASVLTIAPPSSAAPIASTAPAAPSVPTETTSVLPTVGIVAASVGVVALGFAEGFQLHARSKVHDADPHCVGGCDDAGHALYQDAIAAHQRAVVAGIVGGALVTAGVVIFVAGLRSEKQTSVWVSPIVGRASGLALGGTL